MTKEVLSQEEIDALLRSMEEAAGESGEAAAAPGPAPGDRAPQLAPDEEEALLRLGEDLAARLQRAWSERIGRVVEISPAVRGTSLTSLAEGFPVGALAARARVEGAVKGRWHLLASPAAMEGLAGLVMQEGSWQEALADGEPGLFSQLAGPWAEELAGALGELARKPVTVKAEAAPLLATGEEWLEAFQGERQAVAWPLAVSADGWEAELVVAVDLPGAEALARPVRAKAGGAGKERRERAASAAPSGASKGGGAGPAGGRPAAPLPPLPSTPVAIRTTSLGPLKESEAGDRRNLDLLLDVPLQLTVELGRTVRTIREILSLGPGSVLELNRLAGEAVDVLVNGRLIAKGEVVVIDENFGVRITDIVSPAERLSRLG